MLIFQANAKMTDRASIITHITIKSAYYNFILSPK